MITSQFPCKNNYRQEKTEEENTRSQPIPLARESLVEENQYKKPKQREKQDGGA
jgi:TPP-dependent pyruvate/acetoin dehydrogenase alpha subunit